MRTFDTQTCEMMGRALERAWHILQKTNKPRWWSTEEARAALARCIVDCAKNGERNEIRLAFLAVSEVEQRRAHTNRYGAH
jgi:hypothetical protein